MAKNYNYPIILGPGFRKGLIAGPAFHLGNRGKGVDLFIVRLNKDLRSGDDIRSDEIENVEAVLHFCDKVSVKRTIDVLTEVLLKWEGEQ